MNVQAMIDGLDNQKVINPNYNPNSRKKNKESKYIDGINLGAKPKSSGVEMAIVDYNNQYTVDEEEMNRWKKAKVPYSRTEDLDKILAENQSNWTKAGNALAQTIVSELLLGTVKGVSDLFDLVGQAVGISDKDYSNPLSAKLEEWQENFRDYAAIHTDPNKHLITGDTDFGWWASNAPSIISSLTLLIPSSGIVKGLSYLGKVGNIGEYTRKVASIVTGAEKKLKAYRAAREAGEIKTASEAYRSLNAAQRWVNSTSAANATKLFVKNGATAALSRAMENYQESRQTYNDMYADAYNYLSNDDNYKKFLEQNEELLSNNGIDKENRDEIAKFVAGKAADKTFAMDWANVTFDVIQLYGLRNAWKGLKNAPETAASIRRAQKDLMRYGLKSPEELAALKKARSFGRKALDKIDDIGYSFRTTFLAESTEGVEEAINYIAQQEGMHVGAIMLGDKDHKNFTNRQIIDYTKDPELWDAAFWGILGGIVFQNLGSGFRRIQQKFEPKDEKSEAQQEAKDETSGFFGIEELSENKKRISEIQNRAIKLKTYKEQLDRINNNEDVFHSTKENTVYFSEGEQGVREREAAKKRLTDELVMNLTTNAMNNGNLDMLKEFFADENIRKSMIDLGIFNLDGKTSEQIDADSKTFRDNVLKQIDNVEKMYDEELAAINSASAIINTDKNKFSAVQGLIPAEYLQLIALKNMRIRMAGQHITDEITNFEKSIQDAVEYYEANKLPMLNPEARQSIKLITLAQEIGKLRAENREIRKKSSLSFADQQQINDNNNTIRELENQIDNDYDLAWATFMSIQMVKDPNSESGYSQLDNQAMSESYAYRDRILQHDLATETNAEASNKDLEHLDLSERTLKLLSVNSTAEFELLNKKAKTTIEESKKEIENQVEQDTPMLAPLYKAVTYLELKKHFLDAQYKRTVSEIEEEVALMHNTMNQARVQAIAEANDKIKTIYTNQPIFVREYISRILDKSQQDRAEELLNNAFTKEDAKTLKESLEILDLTKTSNRGLIDILNDIFDDMDSKRIQSRANNASGNVADNATRTAEENNTNTSTENLGNTGNNQTNNGTQQGQPINSSQQPQVQQTQINEQNQPINNEETNNRTLLFETPDYAIYKLEDGTRVYEAKNPNILNDPKVYDREEGVILMDDNYVIESHPIVDDNNKVITKGRIRKKTPEELNNSEQQFQPVQAIQYFDPNQPGEPFNYEEYSDPTQPTQLNQNDDPLKATGNINNIAFTDEAIYVNNDTKVLKKNDKYYFIKKGDIGGWKILDANNAEHKALIEAYNNAEASANNSAPSHPSTGEQDKSIDNDIDPFSKQQQTIDVVFQTANEGIQKAVINNPNINIDEYCAQLIEELIARGYDRTIVEKQVSNAKRVNRRFISKAKQRATTVEEATDDITVYSSIIELPLNEDKEHIDITRQIKSDAITAFQNAVEDLMNLYAKEYALKPIDGRYYISLENLLRFVNTQTNDSTLANRIFSSLSNYLLSKNNDKYIVIEESSEINSSSFFNNIRKTKEQRQQELENDNTVIRIDTNTIFKESTEEDDMTDVNKAIDNLAIGQKLNYEVDSKRVIISTEDGTKIGSLTVPKIDITSGRRSLELDGWNYDILEINGTITNTLGIFLNKILDGKTEDSRKLINILYRASYDKNLTKEDKNKLLKEFDENPLIQEARNRGFANKESYKTRALANGLIKFIRYRNSIDENGALDSNKFNRHFYKGWLKNILHNWKTTETLYNNPNLNVTVNDSNAGELIILDEKSSNARDIALPANEALAGGVNHSIHRIGLTNKNSIGVIDISGMQSIPFVGQRSASTGNTFVIIKRPNGRHGIVYAYPVTNTDSSISKDYKEICKAIEDKAYELLNNYYNASDEDSDAAYLELKSFLENVFSNSNGFSSMFKDIIFSVKQIGNNECINLILHNKNEIIQIYRKNNFGGRTKQCTITSDVVIDKDVNGNTIKRRNVNLNDSKVKELFKHIFSNATFNMSFSHFNSDNIHLNLKGIATRKDGKFVVKIGDKTWEYNTYSEFVLNNNLVRLNTKPNEEGTSNYNYKGTRSQKANRTVSINISQNTSSPVEGNQLDDNQNLDISNNLGTTVSERVNAILNSSSEQKGFDIFKTLIGTSNVFTEENLNALNNLHLLPKNIIFDPTFNDSEEMTDINAAYYKSEDKIVVGKRFMEMLSNPLTRNSAIRKLIHERLHQILNEKDKKGNRINQGFVNSAKSIFSEFKENLNIWKKAINDNDTETINSIIEQFKNAGFNVNTKDDLIKYVNHFELYTFDQLQEYNEDDKVEDFLIESVTSDEFARLLNSIQTKEFKKRGGTRNLFQKILKLLSDIFCWKINKGSLYEKEFYALQNLKINSIEKIDTNLFNINNVDLSKVEIEQYDREKTPGYKNKAIKIYLKGQKEKGYFELVKDKENNYYSVHFKTSTEKTGNITNSSGETAIPSTYEERQILWEQLLNVIPDEAIVSTWGSLTDEGIAALNKLGRKGNLTKIGEREVSKKKTEEKINIPIWQKLNIEEQKDSQLQQGQKDNIPKIKESEKPIIDDEIEEDNSFGFEDSIDLDDGINMSSITELNDTMYSSITEINNYTSEEQQILNNASRNTEGKLLAPNGNVSNLNEKQYAQVRTKAFKRWFGDWINPYHNNISGNLDVDLESVDAAGYGTLFVIKLDNKIIGTIPLQQQITSTENFKFTPYVDINSVAGAAEIDKEYKGKGYGKAAYWELGMWLSRNGSILRSAKDNARTEDAERVWKSLEKDGFAKKVDNRYEFVNNASKVVDENGEPLVVYHGGKGGIESFNMSYVEYDGLTLDSYHYAGSPAGIFFTTDKSYAEVFAKDKGKDKNNIYPVFLNIKNPKILGRTKFKDATPINYVTAAKVIAEEDYLDEQFREHEIERPNSGPESKIDGIFGHDEKSGIGISNGVELVVFNPNQIKSATNNNGDFSTEDNNILYSSITEMSVAEKQMTEEVQTFLDNFDIKINEIQDYDSDVYLFDAVNKVINPRSVEDISEATGYAVAFMMQHSPQIKELIALKSSETSVDFKGIRRSIRKRGFFTIWDKDTYKRINYQSQLKEIGKDIAIELRNIYTVKPTKEKTNYISKILDLIAELFNRLNPFNRNQLYVISNNTKAIANAIKLNDTSLIRNSLMKPETDTIANRVFVEESFDENPYEDSIIKTLQKYDIALAGGTSMAIEGVLMRPSENPLHDLDFMADDKTKEDLDNIINKEYPNNSHIRHIDSRQSKNKGTETYLVVDRPFYLKGIDDPNADISSTKQIIGIYDAKTNELIGNYIKSDLHFIDGVQGKFLDFFTGPSNEYYPKYKKEISGREYLISDARNAVDAKAFWRREKDIWDYNNYVSNEKAEQLKEKEVQRDKELIQKIKDSKIIWGHPAIGKTTYIEKHPDEFLEWDNEVNPKRNAFIRSQIDPNNKLTSEQYKEAKRDYMANENEHPEYIEFLSREWIVLKERAERENKKLFVSPLPLLRLFPNDFDLVIAMNNRVFLERNKQRGGENYASRNWKNAIDEELVKVGKDKLFYTDKYFSEIMNDTKENSNVAYSSINELGSAESVESYIQTLPLDKQNQFANLVNSGEVSTKCG